LRREPVVVKGRSHARREPCHDPPFEDRPGRASWSRLPLNPARHSTIAKIADEDGSRLYLDRRVDVVDRIVGVARTMVRADVEKRFGVAERRSPSHLHGVAPASRGTEGLQTPRWRETDSNRWSPAICACGGARRPGEMVDPVSESVRAMPTPRLHMFAKSDRGAALTDAPTGRRLVVFPR
jgi:hypothetical protein